MFALRNAGAGPRRPERDARLGRGSCPYFSVARLVTGTSARGGGGGGSGSGPGALAIKPEAATAAALEAGRAQRSPLVPVFGLLCPVLCCVSSASPAQRPR
jgi:hypothetical protein